MLPKALSFRIVFGRFLAVLLNRATGLPWEEIEPYGFGRGKGRPSGIVLGFQIGYPVFLFGPGWHQEAREGNPKARTNWGQEEFPGWLHRGLASLWPLGLEIFQLSGLIPCGCRVWAIGPWADGFRLQGGLVPILGTLGPDNRVFPRGTTGLSCGFPLGEVSFWPEDNFTRFLPLPNGQPLGIGPFGGIPGGNQGGFKFLGLR